MDKRLKYYLKELGKPVPAGPDRPMLTSKTIIPTTPAAPAGYFTRLRDNTVRDNANQANRDAMQLHRSGTMGRNSAFKRDQFDVELVSTNRYMRAKIE